MIQTESPYYQPALAPPGPFGGFLGTFNGDPGFNISDCGIDAPGN